MWLGWAHHNIKPHRLLLVQINVFILAPFSQCVECICIVNLIIKEKLRLGNYVYKQPVGAARLQHSSVPNAILAHRLSFRILKELPNSDRLPVNMPCRVQQQPTCKCLR